ncbi:MAG: ABC transporter permease subunit [Rhodobacterales bacterium]|nr:ABC transporter permease subunit [Rhodobacterales bacterium]
MISPRDGPALLALCQIMIRRLFREGMVVRSMLWPPVLTAGTLVGTMVVVVLLKSPATVAIPSTLSAELTRELTAAEFQLIWVDDPAAAVKRGDVWAGTDGTTLWLTQGDGGSVSLESIVRKHHGSAWRPVPPKQLPGADQSSLAGTTFVQIITILFALYGVVFGIGMVARDRDDGTLEAELSLPISRWVPGAARWIAGTLVLSIFLGYSIAIFDAIIGVTNPLQLMRHGIAACGGSMTLGIIVIGTAGTKQGFSGPLAFALTSATALFGVGFSALAIAPYVPLASVFAGGSGWSPLGLTLASGVLTGAGFGWRSGKG